MAAVIGRICFVVLLLVASSYAAFRGITGTFINIIEFKPGRASSYADGLTAEASVKLRRTIQGMSQWMSWDADLRLIDAQLAFLFPTTALENPTAEEGKAPGRVVREILALRPVSGLAWAFFISTHLKEELSDARLETAIQQAARWGRREANVLTALAVGGIGVWQRIGNEEKSRVQEAVSMVMAQADHRHRQAVTDAILEAHLEYDFGKALGGEFGDWLLNASSDRRQGEGRASASRRWDSIQ